MRIFAGHAPEIFPHVAEDAAMIAPGQSQFEAAPGPAVLRQQRADRAHQDAAEARGAVERQGEQAMIDNPQQRRFGALKKIHHSGWFLGWESRTGEITYWDGRSPGK